MSMLPFLWHCIKLKGSDNTSNTKGRRQRHCADFKGAAPTSKAPRPLQRAAPTSKAPRPLQRHRADFKGVALTSVTCVFSAPPCSRLTAYVEVPRPVSAAAPPVQRRHFQCSGGPSRALAALPVQRRPFPCSGGPFRAAVAHPVQWRSALCSVIPFNAAVARPGSVGMNY